MKFYLKNRNNTYNAIAEYDVNSNNFTVLKGSRVSNKISSSPTFRGTKSIVKLRSEYVKNGVVVARDVVFRSPSTAAIFVTGTSTNGRIAWKDENGYTFKEVFGGV